MGQTAAICHLNSLSLQYKTVCPVGNPLFVKNFSSKAQRHTFSPENTAVFWATNVSTNGEAFLYFGHLFPRRIRWRRQVGIRLNRRRSGLDQSGQKEVDGRDAFGHAQTPTTRHQ